MLEEQDLKQIPYGIANFKDFRDANYYYVDKTRYIRDIEKKGRYLFFIRPQRFGKSLFLGILEAYYDISLKDRFDFFFNGTEIHQKPTKERNNYMVLKLNFSAVSPNISRIEETFLDYIKESAYGFVQKYAKLLEIDVEKANTAFSNKKNASEVMVTLLRYCKIQERKL
ncbi:MAG: AAA family ATPase, partial [Candidatus Aminicenantes bacterium]|nr:AAA family ATPase [Candidatus Aminicenantes bacterium]